MRTLFSLPLLSLLFAGCVSAQRRVCDQTDWYQHGFDVAMSGRRLDADDLIGRCERAGATVHDSAADTGFKAGMNAYCENENVRRVGLKGEPFAYDLCDGKNPLKLKPFHEAGLARFCLAENGFAFGASGKIYKGVCPDKAEVKWLPEYHAGRAKFLDLQIAQTKARLLEVTADLHELVERRARLGAERAFIDPSARPLLLADPSEQQHYYREETPESTAHMLRRTQLEGEISNINWRIESAQRERDDLIEKIESLRTERITL